MSFVYVFIVNLLGFVLRSVGGDLICRDATNEGGIPVSRLLTTVLQKSFNILIKNTAWDRRLLRRGD